VSSPRSEHSLSDEVRTELKLEEYMRLNGDSDELIASGRKSLSEELQKALKEHGAKTQE